MISHKRAVEVGSNQQPINRVIAEDAQHMPTALVAAIRHSVSCLFLVPKQKRDLLAGMPKLEELDACSSCSLEVVSLSCGVVVFSF
jgi:hypothetical protein